MIMATAAMQPSESIASGLGPAGRALAERHWPMALSLARLYRRRYAHLDLDWEGEAGLTVCQVARRFEANPEGPDFPAEWFLKNLRRRLNGAFVDMMRACYPRGFRLRGRNGKQIPHVTQFPSDPDLYPSVSTPPVGHELETLETRRTLDAFVTPPLRRVLDLLYGEDLTDREAGAVLGWSRVRVTRAHQAALSIIKDQLCVQ